MNVILVQQSKTDQTREGVLLAIDREKTLAITAWREVAEVFDGTSYAAQLAVCINEGMNPCQVSRTFNSIALQAFLGPAKISGHSTRIGAAQVMLLGGACIGQIMAKVWWSKVDTATQCIGVVGNKAIQHRMNIAKPSNKHKTSGVQTFGFTLSPCPSPNIVRNIYLK